MFTYRVYKNEYNNNLLSWITSKFEVVEDTPNFVIIIGNEITINIIANLMFVEDEKTIENAKYNIIINNPTI